MDMEQDGHGHSSNMPRGSLGDSFPPSNHPQTPTSAPISAPISTPISAPTSDLIMEEDGDGYHRNTLRVSLGDSLLPAPFSIPSAPISAPTSDLIMEHGGDGYYCTPQDSLLPANHPQAPTSAPAPSSIPSAPISAPTSDLAMELDGDKYYGSSTPPVYLGDSLLPTTPPQASTSAPPSSISSAPSQHLDSVFDHVARHNIAGDDSAYDSDSFLSDTTSLNSEVTRYRNEHGRQYHGYKDGAYWGPNDEQANEVQDLASHMYFLTLDNKLHLAPINQPHHILDVGTGTGIWAMDMADQYPSAVVTGVDLSPIQPPFVPANCIFEVDDITEEWTYPPKHFDFVHIREMFGSIPDWDSFFREVYRCTKPGGWVEVVEHAVEAQADDGSVPPDHFYREWSAVLMEMAARTGKTWHIWKEAKDRMLNAGFVDVVEVPFRWPMNAWPDDPKLKKIGAFNQFRLNDGCEGFMLRLLTKAGGWSYERAQLFVMQFRKHIRDYSCRAYLPGNTVYGRRPPEKHGTLM